MGDKVDTGGTRGVASEGSMFPERFVDLVPRRVEGAWREVGSARREVWLPQAPSVASSSAPGPALLCEVGAAHGRDWLSGLSVPRSQRGPR